MLNYNDVCDGKQKILFVTAHPDDVIVFFGAFIHALRQENKEVFVVTVTNGARGSRENEISEEKLARERLAEEKAALHVLGVPAEHVFCLNYKDGEVESDFRLIGEISQYIRKFKVDMVCTHEPSKIYLETYSKQGFFVQHRDHRKTGEAVIDAVYPFSRDRSFFTEQYAQGIEPHTVFDLLLTDENGCNFDFDYTDQVEIKREAMRRHASQFDENTINEIIDAFTFNGRSLEKFNYVKLLW